MEVRCSNCNVGTRFMKVVSYDTDRIPHQIDEYKCEKCGCCFDWDGIYQLILLAHGKTDTEDTE